MTQQCASVWAFLGVPPQDPNGSEGIIAVDAGGGIVPLVTSAEDDLPQMRVLAQRAVDGSGVPVRLVRFAAPEELAVFQPAVAEAEQPA